MIKWLGSALIVAIWFILACGYPGIVIGLTMLVLATNLVKAALFE